MLNNQYSNKIAGFNMTLLSKTLRTCVIDTLSLEY